MGTNGKIVGAVVTQRKKGYKCNPIPDNSINIEYCCVDNAHTKKGIGTKLMVHVVKTLGSRGCSFELPCRSNNLGAERLYKKIGFKRMVEKKDYFAESEKKYWGCRDALLMVLKYDEFNAEKFGEK